ncbi:MAG: zinc ribbon domain-containing protein [Thermoplasmata archaeon]|nr:MAG: zinc ribbon domain-containing protein [Thermoplasmata archaeon]
MTDAFCSNCGTPSEPEAGFCANCGSPVEGSPHPPPGAGATMPPAGVTPVPGPMPPILLRPPRNPRQTASYAAAVMVMVSGLFALVFGNYILYYDAWVTDWDWQTDTETTFIDLGPFFAGVMFMVAFAMSLLSCYCSLRLMRYELAVAGPIALLISYFSTLAYESFMLIVSVHILILAVVSLALLYYAIPIYEGRKAKDEPLRPFVGTPPPPP